METVILQELAKYGIAILTFAIMLRYFMQLSDRKDQQNQENLNRFIEMNKEFVGLQKESNMIHMQSSQQLNNLTEQNLLLGEQIKELSMIVKGLMNTIQTGGACPKK